MSEDKTTIFIDTQDMEERYGEELYKEYLEKENNQLKENNMSMQEEIKAVNKGLRKVLSKRKKWKNRYYKEKRKNKQLKEVIEKSNNELIILIQIINEQPSRNVKEDNHLLSRLENISNILVGGNNE